MFSVPWLLIHNNRSLYSITVTHPTTTRDLYHHQEGSFWDISISNTELLSNCSFPPCSAPLKPVHGIPAIPQSHWNIQSTDPAFFTCYLSSNSLIPSNQLSPWSIIIKTSLIPYFFPFIILTWQNLILSPRQLWTLITSNQESEKLSQNQADNSHFKISALLGSGFKWTNCKTICEVTKEIWTSSG